jgi:hypothetical protein
MLLDQLEDGEVVGQGLGGGNDFDELRCEGLDTLCSLLQAFGTGEVVEADEQGGARGAQAVAELSEGGGPGFLCGFHFEVDDLAAGGGGCGQDIQFRGQRSMEVATEPLAAAGGDGGDIPVEVEKILDFGQGGGGFGQEIEAELEKPGVGAGNFGAFQQFRR